VTEPTTTEASAPENAEKKAAPKRASSGGLGGKVLAELQQIAADLGIDGTSMRKGALIDAIKAARGDAPTQAAPAQTEPKNDPQATRDKPATNDQPKNDQPKNDQQAKDDKPAPAEKSDQDASTGGGRRSRQNKDRQDKTAQDKGAQDKSGQDKSGQDKSGQDKSGQDKSGQDKSGQDTSGQDKGRQDKGARNDQNDGSSQDNGGRHNQNQNRGQNNGGNAGDDDQDGSGRRRNRRGRNRNNRGMESEPTYSEDDVLVPAAGILDILDNYAFVRTTGYLPSENDVYVSLSMVRKWNLRRGDAVTGQVRQPREGERKEKFNPMVKIETVNGMSLEESAKRVDFGKLVPVHPTERLRLAGDAGGVTGRVIDAVAPLGKGQRGVVVSPPKSGKTMVLQQLAGAITENNPECHLMVVLVDERPEEVTDFQRSVKGEVIASTFDRPAADHTTVAELAIERAKRLVELGHDVVVLLDGLTRLGRAYNLAASGSGRTTAGAVDASALFAPKKFFGAARNIENGGSLTIVATAAVETGSPVDEVLLDELGGTGNWELRLRRELAEKRVFPAVDVAASSTRREEDLMSADELATATTLRREVSDVAPQQAIETVLDRVGRGASA
jgi:transcription termination factor Rho